MADSIYGLLNYPALSGFLKKSGKMEVGGLTWQQSAKHVRNVYTSLLNM
jgi:glycogen synthase